MEPVHRVVLTVASLLLLLRFVECAGDDTELTDNYAPVSTPTPAPSGTLGSSSKVLMAMGVVAVISGILLLLFGEYCSPSSQRRELRSQFTAASQDSTDLDEEEDESSWWSKTGPYVLLTSIAFAAIVAVFLIHHGSTLTSDDKHGMPSLALDSSVDAQYEHARAAFEAEVYGKGSAGVRGAFPMKAMDFTPAGDQNNDGSSLKRFAHPSSTNCPKRRPFPPPPNSPMQYNGIEWPEMCVEDPVSSHFFIMGDYGGITCGDLSMGRDPNGWTCRRGQGTYVKAADNTHDHGDRGRHMLPSDARPQFLVADKMNQRFPSSQPRYVVNGGDNFYFGGLDIKCGVPMGETHMRTRTQFKYVFEKMYKDVDVPFFGVFGNHDFGGRHFNSAWDQEIAYTWAQNTTGRWIQPGFYWSQKVNYAAAGFTAEYFMFDSNRGDAKPTGQDAAHNICGTYNDGRANCAMAGGPSDRGSCHMWFAKLWQEQAEWLESRLKASTARWKILVTHFPPDQFMGQYYKNLRYNYGVDFFVGSHRHSQELHLDDKRFGGLNWVVVGGGGGITSEWNPDESARGRNQYGFMDVELSKDKMTVTMINERGDITYTGHIKPLVNTPKVLEDVAKTQRYFDGKVAAWHKAIDKANGARAAAERAAQDRKNADAEADEKYKLEKEATDALVAATTASEKATAELTAAEEAVEAAAQAEKDAEAEGAAPDVLDAKAAAKDAADQALSEKKAAARDAGHAKADAEKALGKAAGAKSAADRNAGYKASAQEKAEGFAKAMEDAAQKAEEEKQAAESELAAKKATLKS